MTLNTLTQNDNNSKSSRDQNGGKEMEKKNNKAERSRHTYVREN